MIITRQFFNVTSSNVQAMSIYAVLPVIALISNSILAIYLLWRNPKRIENKLFAFMLLFFALWDVGEILMRTTNDLYIATVGTRMFLMGGFLSAPVYFIFTLFFPKRNKLSGNRYIIGMIVISSVVVMSMNWFTDLLIRTAKPFYWGYSPAYGTFYPMAAFLHIFFTIAALTVLCITYLKTEILIVRKRASFVIIGTMVPIIFGSPTNVILPLLGHTVLELASAFTVIMGGFIAYAILKYKVMIIPTAEEVKNTKVELKLKQGVSYLIEEEKPNRSFGIFVDLVTHGAHGLCVTRIPPDDVRQEFGLMKTPIIWLSRTVDDKMCIDPAMTAELSMTIKNFIEESKNGVVLLDGIEYLIVHNNFNKVLKLLHDLNEAIAVYNAIMTIPIDKRILNEKEYALLVRDIKILPPNFGIPSIPATVSGKSDQDFVTV